MEGKEVVKKLIVEILGSFMPINYVAEEYAVEMMQQAWKDSKNGTKKLMFYNYLTRSFVTEGQLKQKTKIHRVVIDLLFLENTNQEQNKVTGDSQEKDLKQYQYDNKFYYDASINIKIYNWDYKSDFTDKLQDVITHELLHCFEMVVTMDTNSYSKLLYKTRSAVSSLLKVNVANEYYQKFQDFMEIFYLGLPQEVRARTHEAYTQMKNLKEKEDIKNPNELIQRLNQISVFRDFIKVQDYKVINILSVPEDDRIKFVSYFNNVLKNKAYKFYSNKIKYITDPVKFFEYWVENAKKESATARHKIVSQAFSFFNIKEKRIINEDSFYRFKEMGKLLTYMDDNFDSRSMRCVAGFDFDTFDAAYDWAD